MNHYLDLPSWANKAGKLKSLLEAQKRLVERLSYQKVNEDTIYLLIASAEIYEVANDLIDFTHHTLTEIRYDEAIDKGQLRAKLELQSEMLTFYMNEFCRKD
ncbi:MAG: hypothetical protein RLZZ86_49 [Cyanobacteriota bacterium]|jgi:hypothetical protein